MNQKKKKKGRQRQEWDMCVVKKKPRKKKVWKKTYEIKEGKII